MSYELLAVLSMARSLLLVASSALGIGAASFFCGGEDGAEKDIVESPTAEPERPKEETQKFITSESQKFFDIDSVMYNAVMEQHFDRLSDSNAMKS